MKVNTVVDTAGPVVDTRFENLDAAWFRCHGVPMPESAARDWKAWLAIRARSEDGKFKELLQRVVGVSDGAARAYLKGKTYMLGDTTLAAMDGITEDLRREKPKRIESKTGREWPRRGVVLFTRLQDVPSPRFHLEVANCLVRAGSFRGYPVTLFATEDDEQCSASQIAQLLRILSPCGVIWLRQAPKQAELTSLARVKNLPVVVLHGNPSNYATPVIGNVVPDHSDVPRMVANWANRLANGGAACIPIVAMKPETEAPSLRGERIEAVQRGLQAAGFATPFVEVLDYAGANAVHVLEQWPNAPGYACLSDAIAVGVAQLLAARGQDITGRILGFDDSALARRYGITSIDQHLPDAAVEVFGLLDRFLAAPSGYRTFELIRVPLTLSLRPA